MGRSAPPSRSRPTISIIHQQHPPHQARGALILECLRVYWYLVGFSLSAAIGALGAAITVWAKERTKRHITDRLCDAYALTLSSGRDVDLVELAKTLADEPERRPLPLTPST
jgi:hypothetical protein